MTEVTSEPVSGTVERPVTEQKTVRVVPGPRERDLRRSVRRRRRLDNTLRWGTPVVLVVLWQLTAVNELIDRDFFPAPTDVAVEARRLIEEGILWEHLWGSIRRILQGTALGSALGVTIGLCLGSVRSLRVAIGPIISALYTVPKLAVLPLLLLIFGLGERPTVLLIMIAVFFVVCISTTAAVLEVPKGYHEAFDSMSTSRVRRFQHVIIPAAMPGIVVSLRISAGMAVLVAIGVEFVHGDNGLGFLIWQSWQLFLAPRMYVGIVTVALFGVAFQGAITLLGRRLTPWIPSVSGR
ncbi:nitrate ABC transporter permease [Acrocarpospora pleiomorpha]|uniref:Nitrate ABC transporter permease n=1 Tax=Acrocarpospora pleiomorpha TaxID=90975 RepID=A0A5M3X9J0_9ACTN|nr:ABC transporter permease [Acrocarpospora pleiomorpha]GES17326.1 nitrate ABC transporter permease [Acrocarpospora pleiomorpha]